MSKSMHINVDKASMGDGSKHAAVSPVRRTMSRLVKAMPALLLISIIYCTFVNPILPGSNAATLGRLPPLPYSARKYARAAATSFLEVFQVYPPVLTELPDGELEITDGSSNASVELVSSHQTPCQAVLAQHSFAFSYGMPFVGNYTPPSCSFNRVTWNLTVVSAGVQFDRLGIVYLGDIEVFRTSTAEPTQNGIEWTYLKDMTNFLSLFKQDQKVIFDLGNLVNSEYTAAYNVSLTASFFNAQDSIDPADLIISVSTHGASSNMASVFQVPPDTASNVLQFPRNVKKAVFTIAATGQIDEEFWWSNVPQSDIDTFPQYGTLYGYSPFREVQLFIDGMLAGVAWPFPIIFTGGVVPGLWRPIVGIDAFDLKEDEIDISPWLPLLCDGSAHNFTIRVSGLYDNGNGSATLSEMTGGYWLVTGKAFIWYDEAGHVTTGTGPHKNLPSPSFQVSSSIGKGPNGTNETLEYSVNAHRTLSFQSTLHLSHGKSIASWEQDLSFTNTGNYTQGGNVEVNTQLTNTYAKSSSGYQRQLTYPLYAFSTEEINGDNLTLTAIVNRGKDVETLGQPVFPTGLETFADTEAIHPHYGRFEGSSLSTTQNGSATYIANETSGAAFSFGTTSQEMTFGGIESDSVNGPSEELFHRYVLAVNSSVVEDDETLIETPVEHRHHGLSNGRGYALTNVLGRGGRFRRPGSKMKV